LKGYKVATCHFVKVKQQPVPNLYREEISL